jgi:hypothetical protein
MMTFIQTKMTSHIKMVKKMKSSAELKSIEYDISSLEDWQRDEGSVQKMTTEKIRDNMNLLLKEEAASLSSKSSLTRTTKSQMVNHQLQEYKDQMN